MKKIKVKYEIVNVETGERKVVEKELDVYIASSP
jgi:hypothetical protein